MIQLYCKCVHSVSYYDMRGFGLTNIFFFFPSPVIIPLLEEPQLRDSKISIERTAFLNLLRRYLGVPLYRLSCLSQVLISHYLNVMKLQDYFTSHNKSYYRHVAKLQLQWQQVFDSLIWLLAHSSSLTSKCNLYMHHVLYAWLLNHIKSCL